MDFKKIAQYNYLLKREISILKVCSEIPKMGWQDRLGTIQGEDLFQNIPKLVPKILCPQTFYSTKSDFFLHKLE